MEFPWNRFYVRGWWASRMDLLKQRIIFKLALGKPAHQAIRLRHMHRKHGKTWANVPIAPPLREITVWVMCYKCWLAMWYNFELPAIHMSQLRVNDEYFKRDTHLAAVMLLTCSEWWIPRVEQAQGLLRRLIPEYARFNSPVETFVSVAEVPWSWGKMRSALILNTADVMMKNYFSCAARNLTACTI